MAASPNFPGLPENWSEQVLSTLNHTQKIRVWSNPQGRRGRALFVVHGFGEQSDRYLHFPFYLQSCVDAIAVVDLPGHGQSAGARGHCGNFQEVVAASVSAFHAFEEFLRDNGGPKQMHWMGHSFGGLVSFLVNNQHPELGLRSMILSAPLFGIAMPLPPVKKFVGELIAPVLPRLPLKNEIDPKNLSTDPSVWEAYLGNPLNHDRITPRMFQEMNRAMQNSKLLNELSTSTLLLLPLQDRVVDARLSFQRFPEWKVPAGKIKEISTWPGELHEAFNDVQKGRVFNAIEAWIVKN